MGKKSKQDFLETSCQILKTEHRNKNPNFHNPNSSDTSSIPLDQTKFIKLSNLSDNRSLHLFIGENEYTSVNRARKSRLISFFTDDESIYSFRKYKEIMINDVVLILKDDVLKWQDIICSCKDYLKKKTCLHVVSMARTIGKNEIIGSVFLARARL